MPKDQKGWITFKVSPQEMTALETYCQQTKRTKTDVLRAMVRGLSTYTDLISASNENSTICGSNSSRAD